MRTSTSSGSSPFATSPQCLRDGIVLRQLAKTEARILSDACAEDEPYRTLGIGAASLLDYLRRDEPGLFRYAIEAEGNLAGVLVLRSPWLRGAFVDMLSILAPWRRHGLGEAAISWTAGAARLIGANLWATVSAFNHPARAFWAAQGFAETTELTDLVVPGQLEILLRRRLA